MDHMLDDRQIGINELDQSDEVVSNYNAKSSRRISAMNLSEIDEAAEEDFEEELEMLLSSLIINPKVKYSETIVYPKIFVEFIESRMIKSRDQKA